nr:expressed protein [Hymenolepis microstoma]CUU98689.1 hypothetical transcript [Hymenolepis microstoma]
MDAKQELARIQLFLNQPSDTQIFQEHSQCETNCRYNIAVEPGGHIEMTIPPILGWDSRWDVVINGTPPDDDFVSLYFDFDTMTQAFIGCMYVISRRLGMEMPSDVIEFDPEFYDQLPMLSPANGDGQLSTIVEAPQDEMFFLSFYFPTPVVPQTSDAC